MQSLVCPVSVIVLVGLIYCVSPMIVLVGLIYCASPMMIGLAQYNNPSKQSPTWKMDIRMVLAVLS